MKFFLFYFFKHQFIHRFHSTFLIFMFLFLTEKDSSSIFLLYFLFQFLNKEELSFPFQKQEQQELRKLLSQTLPEDTTRYSFCYKW